MALYQKNCDKKQNTESCGTMYNEYETYMGMFIMQERQIGNHLN